MSATTTSKRAGKGDHATRANRRPRRMPTPIPRKLAIRRKFEKKPM
jgi:hypothetical protein